jgi:hypothetical protein
MADPATAANPLSPGEPTFIVGMPRTGSKIYMKLINAFTDINISPEIQFAAPAWIRNDFMRITRREVGEARGDADAARIADLVFAGRYCGTYFRNIRGDKQQLARLLRESDRSPKALFEALLRFDASQRNKTRIGAKFPVHIACAGDLLEWYPNARMIHLNRHPLAIYSSQKRKHLRGRTGALVRAVTTLKVLVATIVSYRRSRRFFLENRHRSNYILFQYEELVTDPEAQVRRLCEYLEVAFRAEMLAVPSKGSSHGHEAGPGIHAKSLDTWRHDVSALERVLFGAFTNQDWDAS